MFDPYSPIDCDRLDQALHEWSRQLEPFREHTRKRITDCVGHNYSDDGTPDKRPVNMGALATSIFAHRLMSANPRVQFSTEVQMLEESALEQEAAVNEWIRRTDAGRALSEATVHALFAGFGPVQVGICPYQYAADDPGDVRLYAIACDDWLHDMSCNRFEDVTVMGHRYRVALSELLQDNSISQERRDKLTPHDLRRHTELGGDKISALSQSPRGAYQEFEGHIELWQLWLPRYKLLCTFEASQEQGGLIIHGEALRAVEWEGPRKGPYHVLDFLPVPNNTIGLAPSAMWEELDDAINHVANKVIRDSERSKSIGIYRKDSSGDAKTIQDTPNGHLAGLEDPEAVRELRFGGPDPGLQNVLIQMRGMLSYLSGNLDQLGGLAPQSDTVGQERLLAAGASVNMNAMSARTIAWAEGIFRDAAYWLFSDPLLNLRTTKKIPGTTQTVPFTMTSERVQGEPDDYRINIDPYTMTFSTPQEKLGAILGTLERGVFPLMGPMLEAGASFDWQYYVDVLARMSGRPEIGRMLQFFGPPSPNAMEGGGGMPTNTTRNYERRDRGGSGIDSMEKQLTQALMSAGSQS